MNHGRRSHQSKSIFFGWFGIPKVRIAIVLALMVIMPSAAFANPCLSAFDEGATRFNREISFDEIRHSAIRTDAGGKKVAIIEYEILETGALFLHRARVEEENRGQGLYRQVVRDILGRHPHVDAIEGELGAENFAIYKKRRSEFGEPPEVAITHVPAYKIRVALGFSEIDWRISREYRHYFHLRMIRSSGK
jgi:hypothetical protein